MLWYEVVREVERRRDEKKNKEVVVKKITKQANDNKNGKGTIALYGLGTRYGDLYFTRRESECMVWLLRGKTINSVATILKLSPRTVEYYIKNMKNKLGCRTKFELIDLVYASEFTKSIEGKIVI